MKKLQRQNWVMRAAFILSWVLLFGTSLVAAQDAKSLAIRARDEGKGVFYTTMALPDAQTLTAIFEKQQTGIKVEMFRSGSGGITNRVQTETTPRVIWSMSFRASPTAP